MNAARPAPGRALAVAFAAVLALGPTLALAPDAAGATPLEVPAGAGQRIDPALDGVPVASAELRRAEGAVDRAQGRLDAAIEELERLGRVLEDLAAERAGTEAELADATTGVAAAESTLALARQRLAGAVAGEHDARDRLAGARADLRMVAVDRYIRSEDPAATLFEGDARLGLSRGRRRVLGAAVTADKVARVVRREGELAAAVRARRAAEGRVGDAENQLARAQEHRRDVAATLADVSARIDGTRHEQARQAGRVNTATVDRDHALLGVLDARVLSEVSGADFPLVALDAYWKAARAAPCPGEWWALAGVGWNESGHGTHGGSALDAIGRTTRPIIGIALNGGNDTARVGDTDGGRLDGDPGVDRAVGPMQFIPSTWARWGSDGDGDGTADPQNLYDAALAAARYLCAASGDLLSDAGLRRAYLAYNHSGLYVDIVLRRARSYQATVEVPPNR